MISDEMQRTRARELAKARYGFLWHLPIYIIVNAGLIGLWAVSPQGFFWPFFPLVFWGLGLTAHYVGAYHARGEAWIARETEKILRQQQGKP
jgi:hypothetical protein